MDIRTTRRTGKCTPFSSCPGCFTRDELSPHTQNHHLSFCHNHKWSPAVPMLFRAPEPRAMLSHSQAPSSLPSQHHSRILTWGEKWRHHYLPYSKTHNEPLHATCPLGQKQQHKERQERSETRDTKDCRTVFIHLIMNQDGTLLPLRLAAEWVAKM